jgi:hypothetical protein
MGALLAMQEKVLAADLRVRVAGRRARAAACARWISSAALRAELASVVAMEVAEDLAVALQALSAELLVPVAASLAPLAELKELAEAPQAPSAELLAPAAAVERSLGSLPAQPDARRSSST